MIRFFQEEISFRLKEIRRVKHWLGQVLTSEGRNHGDINYIFCNDAYLLKVNQEYLQHDTLTDIITFDNREKPHDPIEADIYISVERVRENADLLKLAFEQELKRVMVHGLLHLCGYGDKTNAEKAAMRQKENDYLQQLSV